MVLTSEELQKWNIDSLKKYLMDKGVPLSGGSTIKLLNKQKKFVYNLNVLFIK